MTSSCGCSGGSGSGKKLCPFSLFMFAATAGLYVHRSMSKNKKTEEKVSAAAKASADPYTVVFVLGGPGAGKGTQCDLLRDRLGWAHLSAGDLLRAERASGSELAEVINAKISAGQIVPSEITVRLLQNAMEKERGESGNKKFLIDGFPRSEGNVKAWDEAFADGSAVVKKVLFLDCPEDIMTGRLLERGKSSGRNDDNLDVIRKRFETFRKESMPVVERYEGEEGIVERIVADRGVEDVFMNVSASVGKL
eukprot:CAMPEP_0183302690 /NCGR_PEP_ID=MMETSP0160_2-20130417/8380_1 /TAXON_ID=2839 ORGANISM="Odontella Sinensis, Strain Grunow 1884" /NCGR_SAMPLE_ID=MMETSP0160_2 /ASSEMBLY_ACC=CAM_ASM_000250 /LENGTH=250 /DNA_ID=CAMNT_0025465493 /DNA_START=22 /DNA_END=774 /DNA_ORIENTATION=-